MSFESRLKGLQHDIPLNPVRWLFVVADFAWKQKNLKQTRIQSPFQFSMVGTTTNTMKKILLDNPYFYAIDTKAKLDYVYADKCSQ